jgi:diguanylate cyclase (GGDEF)-like protein
MTLDMPTISLVSLSATTILGLLLCFIWWRERSSTLIGWWGVAQLVMATGIAFASAGSFASSAALTAFGQSLMLLSAAVMWMAVREFEGRCLNVLWVLIWPCAFIIAAATGLAATFDDRLIVTSSALGVLHLFCAAEFARRESQPLVSRWPAVVLLVIIGFSFFAWMPLTLMMPIRAASLVYASAWMPAVVLIALLGRITLAFVVLAIVKERQEIQQRMFALTDPLTGLPNRRALFESAEALSERSSYLKGDPVAVLVFDLDHFKAINDTYGHHLGDRVLQLFSAMLSTRLDTGSIYGRLGGEEFAAILPGANLISAAAMAEGVRAAFADAAAVIDGLPVAGTVSVGVAAHDMDCDLGILFHRADAALYSAKQNGRNLVQAIGPDEPLSFGDAHVQARTMPPRWFGDGPVAPPPGIAMRRYRGSVDAA